MWSSLSGLIIRNRVAFMLGLLGLTIFMYWQSRKAQVSYEMAQVIPSNDSSFIKYNEFRARFGNDGNYYVLGFRTTDVFRKDIFIDWCKLASDIKKVEGVESIAGLPTLSILVKDSTGSLGFIRKKLIPELPTSQAEIDSIKGAIANQPFYNNLFYNDETGATLMAITINPKQLFTKSRVEVLNHITNLSEAFSKKYNVEMHYSGLPYIRTVVADHISKELIELVLYSIAITAFFLLLFFRNFYAVIFPLVVIGILLIWTLGTMGLLGYKITLLTGLIPALIVIMGVPNFIFFQIEYHQEYRKHGSKMRAIARMVEKIGIVSFLVNINTAIGCGVLAFTRSPVLVEFGIVAFISITLCFVLSIILIPVVFHYLPPPDKHANHLENKFLNKVLDIIDHWVQNKKKWIYVVSFVICCFSVWGSLKLTAVGFFLDDVPKKDKIYQDLVFFEKNFKGVMPFEIEVNTCEKNGLFKLANLKKIKQLEDSMQNMTVFGRPLSITDVSSFFIQSYYNGAPERYRLPVKTEMTQIRQKVNQLRASKEPFLLSLVDSNFQTTRISVKMQDIGTRELQKVVDHLKVLSDSIFADSKIKYEFTGTSMVFLNSNTYLDSSLSSGIIWSVILIMATVIPLFRDFRRLLITLIPNIIPLLFTAGLMGFAGIAIKPSTIIIFSLAFGITIDSSLHFLAKYKLEMTHTWSLSKIISVSLRDSSISIIYTNIILFFGFGIFATSSFGGTVALGLLVSLTLIVGMITNILLLPALLLSFDKVKVKIRRSKYD